MITSKGPQLSKNASQGLLTADGTSFLPLMFACNSGTYLVGLILHSIKTQTNKNPTNEGVGNWRSR